MSGAAAGNNKNNDFFTAFDNAHTAPGPPPPGPPSNRGPARPGPPPLAAAKQPRPPVQRSAQPPPPPQRPSRAVAGAAPVVPQQHQPPQQPRAPPPNPRPRPPVVSHQMPQQQPQPSSPTPSYYHPHINSSQALSPYPSAPQPQPQPLQDNSSLYNTSSNAANDDWYSGDGSSSSLYTAVPSAYPSNFSGSSGTGAYGVAPSSTYATASQQNGGSGSSAAYQQPPQPQPPMYNNGGWDGPMDGSAQAGMLTGTANADPTPNIHTFVPRAVSMDDINDYDLHNEPPLLEELGINVEHIVLKTKAVVIPFRRFHPNSALQDPQLIVDDADLAGPLAFALLLGGELLLSGKVSFGYIYGFGLFGCVAMTVILNLMSPDTSISFWTVTSILGYALLPVNLLAAVKIFLFGSFTKALAILVVLWSTTASTRLLEVGCGMTNQRYLLAYPIALLYSAFVLITIF